MPLHAARGEAGSKLVAQGDEGRHVAVARRVELRQPEVCLHAEREARGEGIAHHRLYAGIEAVRANFVERLVLIVEFLAAGLFAVALGLLLAADAAGHVGAGREHHIARFAGAQVVGEEQGQLHIVGRGGAVADGGERLPGHLVETLVSAVIVNEDALVGVLPPLAVDGEGGHESEVLVELPFVAHADLEGTDQLRLAVEVGRETAAQLELHVLCSGREGREEQGEEQLDFAHS